MSLQIRDDDFCMIIASDGVWELLSNDRVAELVSIATFRTSEPARIADAIMDEASYMWKVEEGDYRDDITVVVVMFPWLTEEMMQEAKVDDAGDASGPGNEKEDK